MLVFLRSVFSQNAKNLGANGMLWLDTAFITVIDCWYIFLNHKIWINPSDMAWYLLAIEVQAPSWFCSAEAFLICLSEKLTTILVID